MEKIHLSIFINAPKQKVWETMLNQDTYKQWTKAFNGESRYEGSWEKGSEIKFIGCDENGNEGGMYSKIKENIPYEFISIEHLGILNDKGEIDTTSEQVKNWAHAEENYSFREKDGGTELSIDQDVAKEYKTMFEEMWPKGLEALKNLAESL